MYKLYEEFLNYLQTEDKESAISYVLKKLESNEIDIVTLYTKILAPSLNTMECKIDEKNICIWKEHVRSSIIRTIVECCYPYIIKERHEKYNGNKGDKVVVVCPPEEYHEIGAKMAADFFTLCGYNSIFVGSNTPKDDFLDAINIVKPKYVVISVTNYYNLINAKRVISKIKEKSNYDVKILVGGYAFKINPESYKAIGADMFIDTFEDIENLAYMNMTRESEDKKR